MTFESPNPVPQSEIAAQNLEQFRNTTYTGRGILMGLNEEESKVFQGYYLQGRKRGSQNRLTILDGMDVRTHPYDPSIEVGDPKLTLYRAMTSVNGVHFVTNGSQTDQLASELERTGLYGPTFKQLKHEPDRPINTPRISAAFVENPTSPRPFVYSIAKPVPGNPDESTTRIFTFAAEKGFARILHTYKHDGDPPPPFEGEPYVLPLNGGIEAVAEQYWDVLNHDFRVALVVRSFDRQTGNIETMRIDRHNNTWERS